MLLLQGLYICIICITVKEFNSTIYSLLLILLLRILPHEIISQHAVLYNLHHTTVCYTILQSHQPVSLRTHRQLVYVHTIQLVYVPTAN